MRARSYFDRMYHKAILHDNVYRYLDLLRRSQYWSRDEMLRFQERKLSHVLTEAYSHVPYYKELFDSLGVSPVGSHSFDILEKLPFLSKECVRTRFVDFVSKGINTNHFRMNSTSGSTGDAFKFYSPKACSMLAALNIRRYEWMGISADDLCLSVWGQSFNSKKTIRNKVSSFMKNQVTISGYNLSSKGVRDILDFILIKRPKLLHTYPSILELIASYCLENHVKLPIEKIQTGGEKLFPHQRELSLLAFPEAEIFDFYGGRDAPSIAMECCYHNGLHIMSENTIIEVIDDNGRLIKEGEGNIAITQLHNYAMPLLRYLNGDRVRITQRECGCGRKLPIIDEVIGRSFDIIEFPNGNRVMGTFWTLLLRSQPGIDRFSVIQKTASKLDILYMAKDKISDRSQDYFANEIRKKSGPDVEIKFIHTTIMPPYAGGKHKFVVKKPLNQNNGEHTVT